MLEANRIRKTDLTQRRHRGATSPHHSTRNKGHWYTYTSSELLTRAARFRCRGKTAASFPSAYAILSTTSGFHNPYEYLDLSVGRLRHLTCTLPKAIAQTSKRALTFLPSPPHTANTRVMYNTGSPSPLKGTFTEPSSKRGTVF